MRNYILRGKEPVIENDIGKWALSFGRDNREVAKTNIGKVLVSTMFLGIDHSFGDGPPMLFETMIFGGRHSEEQWRYATWDEAEAGHARAVRIVERDAILYRLWSWLRTLVSA
jgi:hypothetical protein